MAFLFIQLQNGKRKAFPLEEGETILGRSDECDITIDNFSVSTRHAKFVRHGSLVMIEDLGSSNGIYVNDGKAHEEQLEEGDAIQIGMLKMGFTFKESGSDSVDDLLGSLFGDDSSNDASTGSGRISAGSILPQAPRSSLKKKETLDELEEAEVISPDALSALDEKPVDPPAEEQTPKKAMPSVVVQGDLEGGAPPKRNRLDDEPFEAAPAVRRTTTGFQTAAPPPATNISQANALADGAAPPPKIDFSKGKKRKKKSGGLGGVIKGIFSK